jgi:hypothetical protein
MKDIRCRAWVLDLGFGVYNFGFGDWSSGCGIWGSRLGILCFKFEVQFVICDFKVRGSEFRVRVGGQGIWFRG